MDALGRDRRAILEDASEQEKLFHEVFPPTMEAGKTLDWVVENTRDGLLQNTPRNVIQLMNGARVAEIGSIQRGENSSSPSLVSRRSVIEGMHQTSDKHLDLTFGGEYPEAKGWLETLRGGQPRYALQDLASAWQVPEDEALNRARFLHQIGGFLKEGSEASPLFSIPMLFRAALNVVR
jgi:hypothetical protein